MSVASVINFEQPAAAQRRQLAELSRRLFVGSPLVRRKLQHYRPYICPFDRLFQHVAPSARVLDVGCGSGLFLGLLAAAGKGIRGIGFDSSAPAIAAAGKMATRVGPAGADSTLEFVRLDVNDPWPAGEFDVVSIIDVMHHVPPEHQRGLFSTAVKAVTPGGKLIYKDMCRRPLWRAWANRAHDLLVAHQWIHYCPIQSIEQWGSEHGLEPECAERVDLLWYGHEIRVFRKPLS